MQATHPGTPRECTRANRRRRAAVRAGNGPSSGAPDEGGNQRQSEASREAIREAMREVIRAGEQSGTQRGKERFGLAVTVSRCASGDQPTTAPPPSAPPWAPKRPESLQYTFEIGPRCAMPSRHASRIEAGELGVSWWWPPQWSSTNLQAIIRSSVVISGHQWEEAP